MEHLQLADGGWVAMVKLRFAKRLSADWVMRWVAQVASERDAVFSTGQHEAWLVLVRGDAATARGSASSIAQRIAPWAFASAERALVIPISGDDSWKRQLHTLLADGDAPIAMGGIAGAAVVRDPGMRRVYELVDRVAVGVISILILGETGVGKDVIASAIHDRSPRRAKPLLRLNCATLVENLLESELFGHEAGAFTGARQAKAGLLEAADGSTVFLDEVGEMPPAIQAKLLRVIEAREVTRIGSLTPRKVDVRFLSATNRDLKAAVEKGQFREDLFYRLAGATIRVPPLRERRAEVEPLAHLFAAEAARQLGRSTPFTLAPAAAQELVEYEWPGNVRELRNAIDRAALLTDSDLLDVSLFEFASRSKPPASEAPVGPIMPSFPAASRVPTLTKVPGDERARIESALAACAGNQTRAAAILGIARRTLVKKLGRHELPRPRKRPGNA
jgi:transcriptional regulator with GAF, ATPase, and Fis domain